MGAVPWTCGDRFPTSSVGGAEEVSGKSTAAWTAWAVEATWTVDVEGESGVEDRGGEWVWQSQWA